MRFWSESWTNGDRIPERFAAGKPDGHGGATFSDNLNPHLAWSEVPAGAQSLVLICHDFDVPSRGDDVNQPGAKCRPTCRAWTSSTGCWWTCRPARCSGRRRIQPRLHAPRQTRAGGTRQRAPWPERLHRLVCRRPRDGRQLFRLRRPVSALQRFADAPLRVHAVRRGAEAAAAGRRVHRAQVRAAMAGHVLAEATLSGTYTLNQRLLDLGF
jgi:hypothetical protein